MQLDVDDTLYEQLSRRADKCGFESPEAYSIVVLETVMDELEEEDDQKSSMEARLRDLGYME